MTIYDPDIFNLSKTGQVLYISISSWILQLRWKVLEAQVLQRKLPAAPQHSRFRRPCFGPGASERRCLWTTAARYGIMWDDKCTMLLWNTMNMSGMMWGMMCTMLLWNTMNMRWYGMGWWCTKLLSYIMSDWIAIGSLMGSLAKWCKLWGWEIG